MNEVVVRAVEAAIRDHISGTGGYYAGPGTPAYLQVRALLNTREEERIWERGA